MYFICIYIYTIHTYIIFAHQHGLLDRESNDGGSGGVHYGGQDSSEQNRLLALHGVLGDPVLIHGEIHETKKQSQAQITEQTNLRGMRRRINACIESKEGAE